MIRLAIRVARADAEVVLAELLELAPEGVEELDVAELVEYAVYGAPGELPELPDLEAAVGGALVEVQTTEIADDWSERWRSFHRPAVVGGRIRVRPPWVPAAQDGLLEIVIDPGQAFGTGAHPTTRLCLELLLELEPGGALLDIGCGSGVLAIAAAKLGWGAVSACDHDPAAVSAAIDNARANGVALEVARVDLRRDSLPASPVIVANLLGPLLLELGDRLSVMPTSLIASGLLAAEADEIADAFGGCGLRERARRAEGEWAALLLEAPQPSSPAQAREGSNLGGGAR